MTRDDVLQALSILKVAYPHSFQGMTRSDGDALVNLWARQFADEDPAAVRAAIESMIATRTVGYSPTIGEIKEQLHRLRTVDSMNDGQAWCLVEKACRRGLYNAQEEFDKLPPDVQAAVGGPEQLKAWAAMDAETVNSVIASNFRKTYRTVKEREKEKALMPPEVRSFISGLSDKMALGGEKKALNPKPAAFLPVIAPMAAKPVTADDTIPEAPKGEYKPLTEAEWTRRRDELLRQLASEN